MWLVLGLKNPGEKYEKTKHNIGGLALNYIASSLLFNLKDNKKLSADVSSPIDLKNPSPSNATIEQEKVIFATPNEFMNNSGIAARKLLDFYKIPPSNLIVLHDDIELDFGDVKTRKTGSEAGHNGLRSITQYLKTRDYFRVRCGVSRPENKNFPIDKYVLSNFNKNQEKELDFIYQNAYEKVLEIIFNKN